MLLLRYRVVNGELPYRSRNRGVVVIRLYIQDSPDRSDQLDGTGEARLHTARVGPEYRHKPLNQVNGLGKPTDRSGSSTQVDNTQ